MGEQARLNSMRSCNEFRRSLPAESCVPQTAPEAQAQACETQPTEREHPEARVEPVT